MAVLLFYVPSHKSSPLTSLFLFFFCQVFWEIVTSSWYILLYPHLSLLSLSALLCLSQTTHLCDGSLQTSACAWSKGLQTRAIKNRNGQSLNYSSVRTGRAHGRPNEFKEVRHCYNKQTKDLNLWDYFKSVLKGQPSQRCLNTPFSHNNNHVTSLVISLLDSLFWWLNSFEKEEYFCTGSIWTLPIFEPRTSTQASSSQVMQVLLPD